MPILINRLYTFYKRLNNSNTDNNKIAFGLNSGEKALRRTKKDIQLTLNAPQVSRDDLLYLLRELKERKSKIQQAGGLNLLLPEFKKLIDTILSRVADIDDKLIEDFVRTFSTIKIDEASPLVKQIQQLKEKYSELGGADAAVQLKLETNFSSNMNSSKTIPLNEDQQALVANNRWIIGFCIKKFFKGHYHYDELEAAGEEGLMYAAQRYDKERGKFSTYAIYWVRNRLFKAINSFSTITTPFNYYSAIKRFEEEFYQKNLRYPTTEEVSQGVNIPIKTVQDTLRRTISIDTRIDDDSENTLASFLPEKSPRPDEVAEQEDTKAHLRKLIDLLPPKEASLIRSIYGFDDNSGKSLQNIGNDLDVSRQRINQIHKRALKRLREIMNIDVQPTTNRHSQKTVSVKKEIENKEVFGEQTNITGFLSALSLRTVPQDMQEVFDLLIQCINENLCELSKRDLLILERNYGLCGENIQTTDEIAREQNLTPHQVRMIQQNIFKKLRNFVYKGGQTKRREIRTTISNTKNTEIKKFFGRYANVADLLYELSMINQSPEDIEETLALLANCLQDNLCECSKKEIFVLKKIFGLWGDDRMSLTELANAKKVHHGGIIHIKKRALKKLKKIIKTQGKTESAIFRTVISKTENPTIKKTFGRYACTTNFLSKLSINANQENLEETLALLASCIKNNLCGCTEQELTALKQHFGLYSEERKSFTKIADSQKVTRVQAINMVHRAIDKVRNYIENNGETGLGKAIIIEMNNPKIEKVFGKYANIADLLSELSVDISSSEENKAKLQETLTLLAKCIDENLCELSERELIIIRKVFRLYGENKKSYSQIATETLLNSKDNVIHAKKTAIAKLKRFLESGGQTEKIIIKNALIEINTPESKKVFGENAHVFDLLSVFSIKVSPEKEDREKLQETLSLLAKCIDGNLCDFTERELFFLKKYFGLCGEDRMSIPAIIDEYKLPMSQINVIKEGAYVKIKDFLEKKGQTASAIVRTIIAQTDNPVLKNVFNRYACINDFLSELSVNSSQPKLSETITLLGYCINDNLCEFTIEELLILKKIFGLGDESQKTLGTIAKEHNMTLKTVKAIKKRTMEQLRQTIEKDGQTESVIYRMAIKRNEDAETKKVFGKFACVTEFFSKLSLNPYQENLQEITVLLGHCLNRNLCQLTEEELFVIKKYFGLFGENKKAYRKLADEIGCSTIKIQNIIDLALDKIRTFLNENKS